MKVVSINQEFTTSDRTIAFNLDEDISEELISNLFYGNVMISGLGKVLVLQIPEDGHAFASDSVESLNEQLAEAAKKLEIKAQKRTTMLKRISHNTGLPLD